MATVSVMYALLKPQSADTGFYIANLSLSIYIHMYSLREKNLNFCK